MNDTPTEEKVFEANWIESKTVHLGDQRSFSGKDPRGGSQVIPYGDYYLTLTHEVDLFKSEVGRKDGVYRHRFVLFDKNWNVVRYTRDFSIMNGHTEFVCGMCHYNDSILITFGLQDNAEFVLDLNPKTINDMFQ